MVAGKLDHRLEYEGCLVMSSMWYDSRVKAVPLKTNLTMGNSCTDQRLIFVALAIIDR